MSAKLSNVDAMASSPGNRKPTPPTQAELEAAMRRSYAWLELEPPAALLSRWQRVKNWFSRLVRGPAQEPLQASSGDLPAGVQRGAAALPPVSGAPFSDLVADAVKRSRASLESEALARASLIAANCPVCLTPVIGGSSAIWPWRIGERSLHADCYELARGKRAPQATSNTNFAGLHVDEAERPE